MIERKKSALLFFWLLLVLPSLSSFLCNRIELAERRRVRSTTRMRFLSSSNENDISRNEKFHESTLTPTTNKLVSRKVHFASSRRNRLLNRTRDNNNESEYIDAVRTALDTHIRKNQLG